MRTIVRTFFVVIALFVFAAFASPSSASANDGQTYRLQHAFAPHRDSQTGQMIARVNNWSGTNFSGLVCAQEKNPSTGRWYHRGCLKADLAPRWSGGEWAMQFGVPTMWGGSVNYTYQSQDGVWRQVAPAAK